MAAAMRLSDAIEEYLAVLRAQGQSKGTITAKRSALLRFLATTGNIYPKNLGTQHTDAFLVAHLHWQPSTKQVNIAYLSKFQDWLKSRKMMPREVDILEGRRGVRVPKKRRPRVSGERFDALLERAPTGRDRVLLAIGLYALPRASEIVTIQWKHVDLDDDWLEIYRHKTGEYDTLPISAELHEELMRWRTEVCRMLEVIKPDPEWYVTCAMERARLRDENGRYLGAVGDLQLMPERPLLHPLRRIKSILAEEGLAEVGVGMHTLRRSGAAAMKQVMVELAAENPELAIDPVGIVQAMLGHKKRVTTEAYLDEDADRARRDSLIRGKLLYGSNKGDASVVPIRGGTGGAANSAAL